MAHRAAARHLAVACLLAACGIAGQVALAADAPPAQPQPSFATAGPAIGAPAEWRKQSFSFPLPFAPSIPYEGTEHTRFAPSWARFDSPEGFSYVVLWDIKAAPLEALGLERALAVYFDGLMNNAADGRHLSLLVAPTAVALHPLAAPDAWREAYAGAIYTWNAFSRGQVLVLHAEIAQRPCPDERMQVFYAFSQAPRADPVWESLRRARSATPCAPR